MTIFKPLSRITFVNSEQNDIYPVLTNMKPSLIPAEQLPAFLRHWLNAGS